MSGYWKNRAKDVILTVMRGALADGVTREEMLRRVDESYPFGPRKNYPYQAWLQVRKALLFEHVVGPASTHLRKPSEARKLRALGQPELFDEESGL